ncbi:membrane-spanning 4-domains subfamily A member 4A-like isoform X2 [Clupea harengus]|uniref:Membrane-spanning 4-domains subfamily A member 4A-like isoform X2 n=1 Tax=Clupea harengus TaxID=7950 RepID=A0A6P8G6G0_CLUHA|nr:membrane-spanning 4-domains subfamily A member 4A-like isoform X2 [Clupea harengus]XP_042565038.1 membrane-spanning 4-domains subfamily A member 4A-like isoform X2 [Clupea harengus]
MADSVPPASGFVVVTHVYPQQGAQSVTLPQSGVVPPASSMLGKFLKGEPTALGTVQIMIGVVVFLFGIVTAFYASTISTFSGIMFWGAIIYITAGSLTVRANKKLNQCLVKASLGMNILSTTTAGIAIILHSLDLTVSIYPYNACYGESYYCRRNNALLWGIAGVMLVLSLLEFIVSIWVSAFPCKATCSSNTEQVVYVSSQVPPSFPTSQPSAPPQSTQMPFFPTSVVPPLQNCSVHG